MASKLREQILASKGIKREPVEVPEWGCTVYVKTMTGAEREAWAKSLLGADKKPDPQEFQAKLVVRTLVDEDGEPIFEPGDAATLHREHSAAVIGTLFKAADKLNALGLEAVEQAEKNSESAQTEGSSSGGRSQSDEPPANS